MLLAQVSIQSNAAAEQAPDAGTRLTSPNTPGSRMIVEGSSSMTLKLLM
jgi:hypothetical protein